VRALLKFVVAGGLVAAALWFVARWGALHLTQLTTLRDEATLGLLVEVGGVIYALAILSLFGRSWLRSLVRA
jgi:putative peptidoglycan lipid II flippase